MRKSLRGSHSSAAPTPASFPCLPSLVSLVGLVGLTSLVGLDTWMVFVGPGSRTHRRSFRRLFRSVTKSTSAQSIAPVAGSDPVSSVMASTARKSGIRVDSLAM